LERMSRPPQRSTRKGTREGTLTTLVERAAHAAAARSMRSTSAVTVEDSGKLGHADFKDASVGLVPAPGSGSRRRFGFEFESD
jgi:hypothetical protein